MWGVFKDIVEINFLFLNFILEPETMIHKSKLIT